MAVFTLMGNLSKIGFGGGCHWCTEAVYQAVRGVVRVEQGWISPAGNDDFSEAVLVHFDPELVDLSVLVAIHLYSHSATSAHAMRQKYRSAIYVFDDLQGDQVKSVMMKLKEEFKAEVITQILSFGEFRLNSDEFLNYYATDPTRPFCTRYIVPKLKMLLEKFGSAVVLGVKK